MERAASYVGAWLSPAYTSRGAQRLFYPPESRDTNDHGVRPVGNLCLAQTDCRYDEAPLQESGPVPENEPPHLQAGENHHPWPSCPPVGGGTHAFLDQSLPSASGPLGK
jgi:hypothetical protein